MTLKEYCVKIETFLADYLRGTGFQRYVVGVSGGVDSSLTLALALKAVGPERVLALILPVESEKKDVEDALTVVKHYGAAYRVIDLTPSYKTLLAALRLKADDRLSKANLKVRLRMVTLYAIAQSEKGLVLGTDNMSEHHIGYFTKHGDGAADVMPLVHLTKTEVIAVAKLYGLPKHLAERTPSAGLYPGQSDEAELGLSYHDLDAFLLGEKVDEKVACHIEYLHKRSLHKVLPAPDPGPFKRED